MITAPRSKLAVALLSLALGTSSMLALAACNKGPMEKVGEKVDKAVDKTGDSMKKAGDKIEDATTPKK